MSDTDSKLNDILNTDYIPVVHEDKPVTIHHDPDPPNVADANYSRLNYYSLIEKGNEAIEGILNVAKESQHPRAYEVAATLIKNMSEVTEKLMILQKQRKELEQDTAAAPQNVNIDKAVFVGSTAELLKKIKIEES